MYPITILSFGYLHGEPPKADITVDLRELLADPAHRPEGDMLDMTGLDAAVSDFVFRTRGAGTLVDDLYRLVVGLAQVKPVRLALGCAGGRHRSTAIAQALCDAMTSGDVEAEVLHLHVHLPRVIRNEKGVG